MGRIVGMSIGTVRFWEKSTNRQELLKHLRNLPISGVELAFSNKQELFSFKISQDNKDWLRKLAYVSIHAPFYLVDESKDEAELIKQLNRINSVYKQTSAKNVVFHPGQIPPPSLLARYPLSASVENMSKSHGFSLRKLELIMKKYPEMGFCLDVGHAYRYTPQHTKMIVDKFKERIKQVHLHAAFRRKDHLSLRKASKRFLKSIRPIFSIDVPIIIEEDIKQKNARLLRSELAFVQKYLRSITTTE